MALDRVALNLNTNGKPIDYISEADWGMPFEKIYSQNMHRVFCVVQVKKEWLPKLKEWMAPVGMSKILGPMGEPLPDPIKYRDRAVVCDLAKIGAAVGIMDLQTRVQSTTDIVPLINGTELSIDLFKDSMLFDPTEKILDLNTISSGSYTVGAAMDYATWALFAADIAATLTGDLTGTQQTDTTETASCVISKVLNGNDILLQSALDPKGNFNGGYKSSNNLGNNSTVFNITCSSTSAAVIRLLNLNVKSTGTISTYQFMYSFNSNTSNITNKMEGCLGDCNGKIIQAIRLQVSATILQAFNCVMANGASSNVTYYSGGFIATLWSTACVLENLNLYGFTGTKGCGFWNYSNGVQVIKNMACFGCNNDYAYGSGFTSGLGNTVASKCASSDTTGSEAGLRSLVAANQFQSLTLADGDPFLKLKAGSALLGAGVAPSIAANTYGIRGNARPHVGLFSIGADEWKVGGGNRILRGVGRGTSRGMR